jgi:hypothetical protein
MQRDRSPLFIIYPAVVAGSADASAAAPEYHRFIAAQRLGRLLARLGEITGADSAADINAIAGQAGAHGQQPVAVCFSQPQWLPEDIRCKAIAAFSWPYETIPAESWGDYPQHDWRIALQHYAGIISFSQHASTAISQGLGMQMPIHTVVPPLEGQAPEIGAAGAGTDWHLDIHGVVFDTQALGFNDASHVRMPAFEPQSSRIHLHGTVYTAVLDPVDDAKNWLDTLYGFGIAFRDNADVTLVLKLSNPDTLRVCLTVSHWIQKLVPMRCRIVAIIAHLPPDQYAKLTRYSSFYLSTAHAHGKAMAMLEFMAAGVPAIAPRHTAANALLDDDNSLAIDSSREWTYWPHDARQRLATYRYRIVWESVRLQLLRSLQLFLREPERYRQMAAQARRSGQRHGTPDLEALAAWLAQIGITVTPKVLPATAFGDKLAAPAPVRRLLHRAAGILHGVLGSIRKR